MLMCGGTEVNPEVKTWVQRQKPGEAEEGSSRQRDGAQACKVQCHKLTQFGFLVLASREERCDIFTQSWG